MLRAELGNSTWDTLHVALSNWTGISLGNATIYVAFVFTLLVIILNRDIRYIAMAIPIFGVGALINYINDYLLVDFIVGGLFLQVITYVAGLLLLPLGGSLLIISTFPAGVFDEFNLAVKRKLKSYSLVRIRVIMEISAVTVAFLIGILAGNPKGAIGIGTIIFSVTVGSILKTYLNIFERIGLYENE